MHVPLERVLIDIALDSVLELAGAFDHDAFGEEVVDGSVEETGDAGLPLGLPVAGSLGVDGQFSVGARGEYSRHT